MKAESKREQRLELRDSGVTMASGVLILAADCNDEIVCRNTAGVFQSMQFSRSRVCYSAWTDLLGSAIRDEFDRSFTNQHEFGMFVPVRGVRHLSGHERRLMHLDYFTRGQRSL